MKGTVMRSTGSWYDVRGEDGKSYECRIRGKLRLEGIKETNPVTVGDRVEFDENEKVITEILPRNNHILRAAIKKSGYSNVLAANVDQVMIIATLAFPRTSLGFIDRVTVAAEAFRIPQLIVFNKADMLDDEGREKLAEYMAIYTPIGIRCLSLSALYDDIAKLMELLKGKVTLFTGHSGVGKSTLLNRIAPEIKQKTGEVSTFSGKGVHTTTFAEMFEVGPDTFIIDTPGIREWGLVDMTPEEISDYFPEMRERRLDCRFGPRCIHVHEPACAIRAAVESGDIAPSRYDSYLSMATGEDRKK
ncbi:MAG: ribosome small subunit-dependent GTPase A [Cyclobacteriaceae bacterium]|nr:ribosome small subunit-dependent GTPase A [Cyclobacteriaceae bacterium]